MAILKKGRIPPRPCWLRSWTWYPAEIMGKEMVGLTEKEMAELKEKEMVEKARSATKGLKGEELVNKALELYDIYGESAMYYMDVDAYLDEGDTYVSASPWETWENDNVGFAITHGFTETEPEGIENDFVGTYTPEDEFFSSRVCPSLYRRKLTPGNLSL